MVQYQSFPDASGDSRTLDKLLALKLPHLEGRAFLDVGCNEGYFCGFAHFAGAARTVGIDRSPEFIHRAQNRFPTCEFYAQSWDRLPAGKFDVILLASALHYADDQPALIAQLVDALTPDGVLILEIGIVPSSKAEWVKVKRGIDERYFPTMAQLERVLADYAWKWMGTSVDQAGDPVGRHVVHVSRRKPIAYLLMQPPAYGKSSVAARLFSPARVRIVSGDEIIHSIAKRELDVSKELQSLVDAEYSPFTLDRTIQRIFQSQSGPELVRLWAAKGGRADFAMDGFVPAKYHLEVEQQLVEAGYMPIVLRWERVAPSVAPMELLSEQAEAFNRSLPKAGIFDRGVQETRRRQPIAGYVDEVQVRDGLIRVRGWAVGEDGNAPKQLVFGVGAERTFVDVGTPHERKDVQQHLKSPHAKFGYEIPLSVAAVGNVVELGALGFSVTLTSGRPLNLSQRVLAAMKVGEVTEKSETPSG